MKGGKLFNAVGAVADMMGIVDATSDPIESFFGTHDLVGATQSKNTSFHVTSVIATWCHNKTSIFLSSLSTAQRCKLLRESVRQGRRLKRETDLAISKAAVHKLKRLEKEAAATRISEKKKIKDLLSLRKQKLFKTSEEYETFKTQVNNEDKKVIKQLKLQIRLLNKVIGYYHDAACSYMMYYAVCERRAKWDVSR